MKNHQTRPTSSEPFPEVNATRHGRGYGHDRGRGHSRGHNLNNYGYHGDHNSSNFKKIKNNEKYEKEKDLKKKPLKNAKKDCYRCGIKGHWSRTYRTSKHLVDLYQASLKEKGKGCRNKFC